MELKKALFLSQEISPYLPDSPMSRIGRDVPQSLQEKGVEVRTFMPKYSKINERRNQLHEVIRLSGLNIVIDDTDHPLIIKVATLLPSRMQVYFIDNDDYFRRQGSEIEIYTMPEDNDERIMFFARGVIETVKKLRWAPAIIQCSGWATAIAPLYVRRMYGDDPTLKDSRIIYAINEDNLPAHLNTAILDKLRMDGFTDQDIKALIDANQKIDTVALGKLAIDHSDAIIISTNAANPELVEYAVASGKPILTYPGGAEEQEESKEYLNKYIEFYRSL